MNLKFNNFSFSLSFILLSIAICVLSIINQSLYPILIWILYNLVLMYICIKLAEHKMKKEEDLLKDFPNDFIIQQKYGKNK